LYGVLEEKWQDDTGEDEPFLVDGDAEDEARERDR